MDLGATFSEIIVGWLQSLPIVVGLVLTVVELRHTQEAQRFSNRLRVTENHRQIWQTLFESDRFKRVLDPHADVSRDAITNEESLFVTFLILHLKTTFWGGEAKLLVPAEAIKKDILWFFSLPIPNAVWQRSKEFQDQEFVAFVDNVLAP